VILRIRDLQVRGEMDVCWFEKKSDWGTLVPRINVENGIKLGFSLE
jgi:hypothetical protein